VGDRPVHKLPFGPKCHEPFVILYSILANLSDGMLFVIVEYNITNGSWHFGPNGSLWTGLSPTKQYMDLSFASVYIIFYG
jgi:hypothetical protein